MAESWIRWISVLDAESTKTKVNIEDLGSSIHERLRIIEDNAKQLRLELRRWFDRKGRKSRKNTRGNNLSNV
jgi:hypothetical protein